MVMFVVIRLVLRHKKTAIGNNGILSFRILNSNYHFVPDHHQNGLRLRYVPLHPVDQHR